MTRERVLLSLTPGRQQCQTKSPTDHTTLTSFKVVAETYTNVLLRVRSNRKPLLPANVLLAEVYVLVLARVDDLDVEALAFTRPDVCGDDDECTGVRCVPYAFGWGVAARWYVELDCGRRLGEADEEGGEEKREGAQAYWGSHDIHKHGGLEWSGIRCVLVVVVVSKDVVVVAPDVKQKADGERGSGNSKHGRQEHCAGVQRSAGQRFSFTPSLCLVRSFSLFFSVPPLLQTGGVLRGTASAYECEVI